MYTGVLWQWLRNQTFENEAEFQVREWRIILVDEFVLRLYLVHPLPDFPQSPLLDSIFDFALSCIAIQANVVMLLFAGTHNLENVLGHALRLLLSHPQQLRDLQSNPSLLYDSFGRYFLCSRLSRRLFLTYILINSVLVAIVSVLQKQCGG